MATLLSRRLKFYQFCIFQKCLSLKVTRENQRNFLNSCFQLKKTVFWKNKRLRHNFPLTILTTTSFFLYLYKEKLKVFNNFMPSVYASEENNNNNLRKRFNFFADVAEKCQNSVVAIECCLVFNNGFQEQIQGGTGFIVEEDGLILTNAHVVSSKGCVLNVKLKDGRIYRGKIEALDLNADLAAIRIKEKNLPVMKLGSSTDLRAGEWVIAIGAPLYLGNTVTAGIVSCPLRKAEDLGFHSKDMYFIQTDASITFGNSGGPLVNLSGEVVGVNNIVVATGISFAIPVDYVKEFFKKCKEKKKNELDPKTETIFQRKCNLGVVMLTLTKNLCQELRNRLKNYPDDVVNNVLICDVQRNSPAYLGGLQVGDVIVEINGQKINGVNDVYKFLEDENSLTITVFRNNQFYNFVFES